MGLTRGAARAEDVVQETLLRAWQHPEVTNDSERSAGAWLFTVARNMIIDERRSARFRKEISPRDGSGVPEHAGPDEVNAALDRMLIGDAVAESSPEPAPWLAAPTTRAGRRRRSPTIFRFRKAP